MTRRIAAISAPLAAWASFGLVTDLLFYREITRCTRFGDLAAECRAPFALLFTSTGVMVALATLVLATLALRLPLVSDQT